MQRLTSTPRRRVLFGLAVLACSAVIGCGEAAPDLYHLSGNVTFDNKPIPKGKIYFVPDAGQENKGPAGYAEIVDGKFDTKLEGGRGHSSGAMVVRIEGFDPAAVSEDAESGEQTVKMLFPSYETTATLPKEDSTQDFDVPAEAAKRVDQKEGGSSGGV